VELGGLVARPLTLAAALAVSLLAVSAAGGAATQQTPKRGGTLVMGTLREPGCLNAYLLRCSSNLPPVGAIMRLAFRGAFRVRPDMSYAPDLVARVDYTTTPPFTLTYHIRPDARWSDGVPITARDFVFTQRAIRSVLNEVWEPERPVYGVVRGVRRVDERTVEVILRSRFAGWRGLFPYVLPAHALEGTNFSSIWLDRFHDPNTGRPIGSGPFLVAGWERGRTLTFVRNPRYWKRRAYLDRLILRFWDQRAGALGQEQVELMRGGSLDLVRSVALSGPQVRELRGLPGVRVLARPGASWEHIEIRLGSGGHPALKRKLVRRALAYGIDRVALARALYGQVDSAWPPVDSAIFIAGGVHYRPNWRGYRFRPEESRRLLEQDGCRRGSDGIFVCGGEHMSLRLATIAGDPRRQRALEAIQRQLRQTGIDIQPVYAGPSTLFEDIVPSGTFDLAMFSYLSGPDAPGTSFGLYGCGAVQNYSGYCQRLVSRDLDQARRILDAGRQAQVLHRVDAQLAKDVPVIPLYQNPVVAASNSAVRGVRVGVYWDAFANAEDWWLAE
jgi:peptide/nickel transport system substrate-binding protein